MYHTSLTASFYRKLYLARAVVLILLCSFCSGDPAQAVDDVYMFSYFRDPDGTSGMYFAYSLDGLSYHAVNGDTAITGPMAGTSMRDVHIAYGPVDQKFHLTHTTEPWNSNTKICYGDSADLITWGNNKYLDVMGWYANNGQTVNNTWAPEPIYDAANNNYMIYWSANVSGEGDGFRTYYLTTADFSDIDSTDKATKFYDPGRSVIDANIVKDPVSGNYVMFVKNEYWGNPNTLYVYKAQGGTSVTGPYELTGPQVSETGHPFEGPTTIKIGDTWYLYGDYFTDSPQKMGVYTSSDEMATWTEHTAEFIFPTGGKHGSVFKVPRSVADNLIASDALQDTVEIEFDGNAGTSNYINPGNWLGNAVPTTSQIPVIQNGFTANLSSAATGTLAGLKIAQTTSGALNMSGGAVLNVNGNVNVGRLNAVGSLGISGGTLTATGSIKVANGAVHLDGGTISTAAVNGSGNSTTFHFNGGTLKARASTTDFVQGLNTLDVESGGAAIDTNGYNVTIPQALTAASADGGLTKKGAGTLTLITANTYSGPTIIAAGTLKLGAIQMPITAHRWSFNGSLVDSVGGSDAAIVDIGTRNVSLTTVPGQAYLTGGAKDSSDYVQLGSNLLPDINSPITIELWATQRRTRNWSRIFDFGSSDSENLFMSWTTETTLTSDRVEWKDTFTNTLDNTNQPYDLNTEYHIVMTLNPVGSSTEVTWYSAPSGNADIGSAKGSFTTANTLADLTHAADNLGRSFWPHDTASANYNEVRFWDGALGSGILEVLHDAGPDANLGSLNFGGPGSLPITTAVNITASGATLDLNNISQTVASLSGVTGSSVHLGSGTLTINGNTSTTFSGNISGAGGFTKSGTGTLTLTGDPTYTGETIINTGCLQLDTGITSLEQISGAGQLSVGSAVTTTDLTVTSIAVGTLTIAANSKVSIRPLGGAPLMPSDIKAVPEPSVWMLLLLAAASAWLKFRREKLN